MSSTTTAPAEHEAVQEETKPIHIILLDTSPILLNTPSISTLLANSNVLVTTQSVLAEIRGEEARNRLDTLYKPFLSIRSPKSESVKFVKEFARKTGDSGVLSATDFEILALAYDLECERNGGDWRLRTVPGQKRLNGSPPQKEVEQEQKTQSEEEAGDDNIEEQLATVSLVDATSTSQPAPRLPVTEVTPTSVEIQNDTVPTLRQQVVLQGDTTTTVTSGANLTEENLSDSEDGWITPSNIKRHLAKEDTSSNITRSENRILQVATMTGDFAMQNVLLQMNLNLLSTRTCKRVAHIKQMILRCHACFATTKDMSKQFCPRCGGPTLTRVTCTTNDRGEVKLHLKANHQWNNRGNVFSIPKPSSGSSNQKWKGPQQGGGQRGWGNDLILAEDQKEYAKAVSDSKRTKNRDLMDEDALPNILTGDRNRGNGRIRVGAGKNVNSKRQR